MPMRPWYVSTGLRLILGADASVQNTHQTINENRTDMTVPIIMIDYE